MNHRKRVLTPPTASELMLKRLRKPKSEGSLTRKTKPKTMDDVLDYAEQIAADLGAPVGYTVGAKGFGFRPEDELVDPADVDLNPEPEPEPIDKIAERDLRRATVAAQIDRIKAEPKYPGDTESLVTVTFIDGEVQVYPMSAQPTIARYLGRAMGEDGVLTIFCKHQSVGIPSAQIRHFTIAKYKP